MKEQKKFNERIVMSLLRQCAWVWENCTVSQAEGEFTFNELLRGFGRNGYKNKTGVVSVFAYKCKYWDVFNKTQPIDGLTFDVNTLTSRMTFQKEEGHFSMSFPIVMVYEITQKFCVANACQSLMNKTLFCYKNGERWAVLPKERHKPEHLQNEKRGKNHQVSSTLRQASIDDLLRQALAERLAV